ncbi:hypothetical protein BpHYR1_038176 [Brachionus plicatilis]|uniref:Uncharacterized protein n=1 Tax=Brachionus plicatilis TaxID=10195 RepID=A0A3M7PPT0_BRAPC|nr:hypothetical protein BpHYR1_038176 [Brachionus plicatilis]
MPLQHIWLLSIKQLKGRSTPFDTPVGRKVLCFGLEEKISGCVRIGQFSLLYQWVRSHRNQLTVGIEQKKALRNEI